MAGFSFIYYMTLSVFFVRGQPVVNQTGIEDNEYIVELKPWVAESDPDAAILTLINFALSEDPRVVIFHNYSIFDFVGVALNTTQRAISAIRAHSSVQDVWPNRYVLNDAAYLEVKKQRVDNNAEGDIWGLARISQRQKLNLAEEMFYEYDNIAGSEVYAYVIDSVVDVRHPDFEGRAQFGYNAVDETTNFPVNLLQDPKQTHGTHVAGTIGGKTHGVAKKATIVSVKADTKVGNSGRGEHEFRFQSDDLIEALEWIEEDHSQRKAKDSKAKSVINMSLGGFANGSKPTVVEKTIIKLIKKAGIPIVVSAGNAAYHACNQTPARVADAITVGCSDYDDRLCTFSNHGNCVDIIAPGYQTLSTLPNNGAGKKSGTSMSAPHVSGVVARFLALHDTPPTPEKIKQWLIEKSTKDAVTLRPTAVGTPNRLLFMSPNQMLINGHSTSASSQIKGISAFTLFLIIAGSASFVFDFAVSKEADY
ncbi:subtilisin-like protease CPC735_066880 [Lingula anatina]|uniref:Subtilisin-like protease CPC735_066880 n=1 Tax=Lingula anatina TaxID=7574 RepID=A0A1S3JYD3_LINAN|nr:subtilisin-like protease CPC735_066880 [Lingula anatina]|eukprot:XP_013415312.1 subtilisin-like protease CPC735_066880 [Lingula anatina]